MKAAKLVNLAFIIPVFITVSLSLTLNSASIGPNAQTGDTAPPQLLDFRCTPDTIDVSSSSQEVRVTFRARDDLSGFGGAELTGLSPSLQQSVQVYSWVLISGDARDGVYEMRLPFPRFSEGGFWHIGTLRLSDPAVIYRSAPSRNSWNTSWL